MAAHNLVERAFDIVTYLADQPGGRSVSAIAEMLKMPPSAAHRLLGTLSERGLVAQDERTRDYSLTLSLPALGLRYLSTLTFVEACKPVMDSLASSTRELVRLAVVSGTELIWIAKSQGSKSSLRLDPLEGRNAIPHVTAAGKAWLASMPDEQATKRFTLGRRQKGVTLGPNAHTDADKFLAELQTWRRRGYAVTYEEAEPGIAAVGAVVRNGSRVEAEAVATISVAGPTARLRRKDLDPIGETVADAARQLSAIWPATHHLLEGGAGRRRGASTPNF
jgi:IclR family acetate operon transcriptional repressor